MVFAPDEQARWAVGNLEDGLLGEHPTLNDARNKFGDAAPVKWLFRQLNTIPELYLTDSQLVDLAQVSVVRMLPYTFTQVMIFIFRFRQGLYGTYFGKLSSISLGEKWTMFEKFLREYRLEHAPKPKETKRANGKSISREEYDRILCDVENGKIRDIRALFPPDEVLLSYVKENAKMSEEWLKKAIYYKQRGYNVGNVIDILTQKK